MCYQLFWFLCCLRPTLLEISFIVSVSFTNVVPNCVQRYEKIILAFNRKQCTVFIRNNLAIDIYLDRNPPPSPQKNPSSPHIFLTSLRGLTPISKAGRYHKCKMGIKINFIYLILFVLTGELKFYSGILGIILCACLHLSFTSNNQSWY